MIPILCNHNPQEQIGKCEEKDGKFIVTLDQPIRTANLFMTVGAVQVLEYESKKDHHDMVKKFIILSFIKPKEGR